MTQPPTYGPHNPHPLSQMKTELVWESKYDEYGNRREVDVAGCAMPMQKIESIDEPRRAAAAEGQLGLFEQQNLHQGDFRNRLIWGDNKLVMASLLKEFRGKVDLVYIDPPFDVGADFSMSVAVGDARETLEKDQSTLEMVAYRDMWGKGTDSYLHMIFERLTLIRELLSENGSLYIHIGPRISHSVRSIAEEIFGRENLRSHIIWNRTSAHANVTNNYGAIHESILFLTKSGNWTWNQLYQDYSEDYIETFFDQVDENGRRYARRDLTASMSRASSGQIYTWKGITPVGSRCWAMTQDNMDALERQGRIHWPKSAGGMPRLKFFADEAPGIPLQDLWEDIGAMHNLSAERLDYATQKPEALLERIVKVSSNEGDLVADFFCGSGTIGAVAERLNRRWLMCDLGRFAIHTSRKRLIELQRKQHNDGKPYRAFDVYNLGRYERQWWQQDRLKGADQAHRQVVLEFFRAEVLTSPPSPLIHGRKGSAFCHVDGIDSMFTRDEAQAVAQAVAQAGGRVRASGNLLQCYCLAWEFEMDLHLTVNALAQELGVKLKLVQIPREIMEKNRTAPPPFLEVAVLEAQPVYRRGTAEAVTTSARSGRFSDPTVDIKLTQFIPSLAEVPTKELEAIKERAMKSGFFLSIAKAMTTNVCSVHFSEHRRRCYVRIS